VSQPGGRSGTGGGAEGSRMFAAEHRDPAPAARSCGDCSLCCKVMAIAALDKPPGSWCRNCRPGRGCVIYGERPQECRDFACLYLISPELGEEWKPSRSKIVLVTEKDGNRIIAKVDPQQPDAWKRRPYYQQLKEWAARSVPFRGQVIAAIGQRMYMIFPDRDVDLGIVDPDDLIVVDQVRTPAGVRWEAAKISKDDPRARGLPRGTS
jgi:hypothetical protein